MTAQKASGRGSGGRRRTSTTAKGLMSGQVKQAKKAKRIAAENLREFKRTLSDLRTLGFVREASKPERVLADLDTLGAARSGAVAVKVRKVRHGKRGRSIIAEIEATAPAVLEASAKAAARVTTSSALTFAAGLQEVIEAHEKLSKCTRHLAENVAFTVTTKTRSGEPIQNARGRLHERNLDAFRPNEPDRDVAVQRLDQLGFKVLRQGRFATTAVGPAELLREVLGQPLMVMRQAQSTAIRAARAFSAETTPPDPRELFLAPATSLSVRPKAISPAVDHFVFAPPALLFAPPSATAPNLDYFHIGAPQIRTLLNFPIAGAEAALSGNGIKVGIVDTGFLTSHPYYASLGVNFTAHASPGGPAGDQDPHGHGTAMAFNIFALASKAEVHGVRQAHPPYSDAIETAVDDLGVDIVTCSWGWDREQSFPTLEASLQSIVADGKIVLFAAGNGHYAWPGTMPDVITVGGVYADEASQLEASNYASGFMSSLYPQRQVPDVCGLCGQTPRAVYIPMPLPPACEMDREFSGLPFPDQDQTTDQDGWVVASGTSSATPQVAGILACLLQAARAKGTQLTNAIAKDLLQQSARNVSQGRNAFGFPATTAQPNGAVGYGLVDTAALFNLARQRGLI